MEEETSDIALCPEEEQKNQEEIMENKLMNINDNDTNPSSDFQPNPNAKTKLKAMSRYDSNDKSDMFFSTTDNIFPSKHKPKNSLIDIVLILMSCLVLLISLIFLVFFFIIKQVPSIYFNKDLDKSLLDTRTYEIIRLLNGIEVMLISEANSAKSAFALGIKAGFDDNSKYGIRGLGNLVKRLIMNGPLKGDMNDIISKGFGDLSSEQIGMFNLVYSFDVSESNMHKSLEIFAKMIKINEDDNTLEQRIIEEVNEIDTLYHEQKNNNKNVIVKKLIVENIGEDQFYYLNDGPKEQFYNSTFTIKELQKMVLRYFNENYIAEKMKISIISNMKIKQIKGMIIKLFSDIPSNKTEAKAIVTKNIPLPKSPFNLGRIILLRFKDKTTMFSVAFLIKNIGFDVSFHYLQYIHFLITSDQRQGSLAFLLKKNNYILNHNSLIEHFKNDTAMITFHFYLTKKGLFNIDDVLFQIFNYLKLIRYEKPGEVLYNELIDCTTTKFKYQEFSTAPYKGKVAFHVNNMFEFKDYMTKVLMGGFHIPPYNKQFIEAVMDILTPQNAMVALAFKSEQAEKNVIPKIDKMIKKSEGEIQWTQDNIYDATYDIHSFNDDILKVFETVDKYDSVLSIRAKNEYITKEIDMVNPDSEEEKELKAPKILIDATHVKIYHKLDRTFRIPKIVMTLYFTSPFFPDNDSHNYFTFLFHSNYIKTAISLEFSSTKEAGSNIIVITNDHVIEITITAYSDVFENLLQRVLELYYKLNSEFITESLIFDQTEASITSYNNKPIKSKTLDHFSAIIKNHLMSIITTYPPFAYEDLINRIRKYSKESFVRGVIYGNINKNNAMKILENYLLPNINTASVYFGTKYHFFNEYEVISHLLTHEDINGNIVIRMKNDKADNNIVLMNTFFLGNSINEIEKIVLLCLRQLIEDHMKELMAKKKYASRSIVFKPYENNYYLIMNVFESGAKELNPIDINKDLDDIIADTKKYLEEMNEDIEMYKMKYNMVQEFKKSDNNLSDRVRKVASVIKGNRENFDRSTKYSIEKFNKEFTKEMFIERYKQIFYINVKKISLQKTYKDEIDMTREEYDLNRTINTVITDDLNYLRKKHKIN